MDVRIGVLHTPRELEIEMADDTDRDQLLSEIETQLGQESGVLWLTDRRGRRIAVPVSRVAFVEVGSPKEERRVGFGV
ncbi:MAG: DUF3107 domain-containing protein [Acidimicrobiia bacterium]